MSATRIGVTGPVFGTSTLAYGIIENEEKTTEVEESEIRGGDGDIIGVDQYGKKTTVSFEYTYRSAAGPDEDDVGTAVRQDALSFRCAAGVTGADRPEVANERSQPPAGAIPTESDSVGA